MSALYKIAGDFQKLFQMAEEEEINEQVLADTLESLEYDLSEKAEQYAKIIKELEGQALMIKEEKERLETKQRTINNNIKKMKEALKGAMAIANIKKIKTNLFSFNIQKASNRAVVIDGEVPQEYLRKPEPDTMAIKELLKVRDVEWAHLKEATEFLSIR